AGTAPSEPLRSVPAAVERAQPGTVITLLPGRYAGGIVLNPGAPGRPITLRGACRGRVIIGEPPALITGWTRVDGLEYTYVADTKLDLQSLMESSTGRQLRPMPSLLDVEELAGTFYHDVAAGKIYLHPSDSESAERHLYIVPSPTGLGILLADHTVVEDLVLTGMGNAAIRGNDPTNAVVRHCLAYGNGYAVELRGGRDCVISGNHFWANVPKYAAGSQVYVTKPRALGIVIENNLVYDSSKSGVRFYDVGEVVKDCVLRGNIIKGSYSKGVPRDQGLHAENNVSLSSLWAHAGGHNTYGFSPRPEYIKQTDLLMNNRDWHFADPAYMDYRLQADSPARGAAPDGSDRGAFPYDASVVFVSPDGDDSAAGTAQATAWRTLRQAVSALRPGHTLYLEPGAWDETLVLEGLHGEKTNPIRIRVRGRGRAVLSELRIRDCANLELEGLGLAGDAAVIEVRGSHGIVLRRCWVTRAAPGAGIVVGASRHVTLEHCAVAGGGVGLLLDESHDVELVSSLLAAAGAQIELRGDTRDFWSEYNAFAISSGGAPLAATPAGVSATLEEWRALRGMDLASHVASIDDFVDSYRGDFRARAGRPPSYGGRYEKPVGPHEVLLPAVSRQAIERVEVVSTTRTSANITYWTPGRVTGTLIEWGKTPEYGESYDRAERARGEYETFHTVSLLGLEPETTYHFRVGFRDHHTEEDQGDNESADIDMAAETPLVWSADYSFTTAAADPEPRLLYVASDGDDARDGLSATTAWRSLHKAAREARAGDTVTIAPGRYLELLRPLQTGTSEQGRITFRAERPLTVFLDGGFDGDGTGRSHAVQLMSKSFITLENLVFEKARNHDNGGYRGWPGYAGLVRISGSTGVELKACVMEGRHRFMVGLVAEGLGTMPGAPPAAAPLMVSDSLFIGNWFSFFVGGRGPNHFHHNAIVRSRLLMAAFSAPTELRNNIYQSLGENKWGSNLFVGVDRMDSDYNCFGWDQQNEHRVVAWLGRRPSRTAVRGLQGWQEEFGQDPHGIEADPGYPLSAQVNFGGSGKVGPARPLSIDDLILPPDSPCRGAGENGADIGPRWERFLD
ncbi:MAG: right-handed parallel beta-helix repeat-containing protein, partial [Kiritimatiellia bacterium]